MIRILVVSGDPELARHIVNIGTGLYFMNLKPLDCITVRADGTVEIYGPHVESADPALVSRIVRLMREGKYKEAGALLRSIVPPGYEIIIVAAPHEKTAVACMPVREGGCE